MDNLKDYTHEHRRDMEQLDSLIERVRHNWRPTMREHYDHMLGPAKEDNGINIKVWQACAIALFALVIGLLV